MTNEPIRARATPPSAVRKRETSPVFSSNSASDTYPSGLPSVVRASMPDHMMHASQSRPRRLTAARSRPSSGRVTTRSFSAVLRESSARNASSRLIMPATSGRFTVKPTTRFPSGEKTAAWTLPNLTYLSVTVPSLAFVVFLKRRTRRPVRSLILSTRYASGASSTSTTST